MFFAHIGYAVALTLTFFILLGFSMHVRCAKNIFAKYCGTMFLAYMAYAVALTTNKKKCVLFIKIIF